VVAYEYEYYPNAQTLLEMHINQKPLLDPNLPLLALRVFLTISQECGSHLLVLCHQCLEGLYMININLLGYCYLELRHRRLICSALQLLSNQISDISFLDSEMHTKVHH